MLPKNLKFFSGIGFIIITFIVLLGSQFKTHNHIENQIASNDLLIITGLKKFQPLERSAVPFPHDQHTYILEKQGLDCFSCHNKNLSKLDLSFKNALDFSYQKGMDIFHDNCIGCHRTRKANDQHAGPVVCGECHTEKVPLTSNRSPMDFGKSMHAKHNKTLEKKCESCHHSYNEETKKIFYEKGKEGACLYCHAKNTDKDQLNLRKACHLACVSCHQARTNAQKSAGPIHCNGCHDSQIQKQYSKIDNPPRYDRNQPDARLLAPKVAGEPEKTVMPPVAFNHLIHEEKLETCRECHHKSIGPCQECHSVNGTKESQNITLFTAMHQLDSFKSCVGCHQKQQAKSECQGCHHQIPNSIVNKDSCNTCHLQTRKSVKIPRDPKRAEQMAKRMLAKRKPNKKEYPAKDIPEKVVIDDFIDTYQKVEFPHRRIVDTLRQKIQENQLAIFFHRDQSTICQGCHHRSPATATPPKCSNCHWKIQPEIQSTMPNVIGAYHQQCIGCHQQMNIEKPRECIDCHKEKS